jgi:hypothetical protein
MRKFVFVASLLCVGVLAWTATRAVIGAQKAKPPLRITVLSKPTFTSFKTVAVKGGASVAVTAELGHKTQDQELVWLLKAFQLQADGSWKVVSQHQYLDQIFIAPNGKLIHPTFQETIPLVPGSYAVQIEVQEIRRDVDPTNYSIHTIVAEHEAVVVK